MCWSTPKVPEVKAPVQRVQASRVAAETSDPDDFLRRRLDASLLAGGTIRTGVTGITGPAPLSSRGLTGA